MLSLASGTVLVLVGALLVVQDIDLEIAVEFTLESLLEEKSQLLNLQKMPQL